jgi:5-methylthioribose kinase
MGNLLMVFNQLQSNRGTLRAPAPARPVDRTGELPTELTEALQRMQLLARGDPARASLVLPATAASGAQIYKVELGWGTLCLKHSMPKVHRHGIQAPEERSRFAAQWLRFARDVVGEAVPELLGEEPAMLAMEYLDPKRHSSWMELLRDGDVSPSTAAEAGRLIGRIHAASANNLAIAQRFQSDHVFHELRIAPMFLAAARAQPSLAERLEHFAATTARAKIALLHGDLIPENILVGPRGPVLVDADGACYGDPAFDAACCLSHLVLMGIWRPQLREQYLTCYDAFRAAYLQRVTWEMPEQVDERAALLLPAIMMAAVHGDDPVGFLYGARERDVVTGFARRLLVEPVLRLSAVRESWRRSFLG